MNIAERSLDTLHKASEMEDFRDKEISSEPGYFTDPDDNTEIDFDAVFELLERRGLDPATGDFSSMAIVRQENSFDKLSPSYKGFVTPDSIFATREKLYAPVINVHPSAKKQNNILRHELSHLGDEVGGEYSTYYRNPNMVHKTRLVAGTLGALAVHLNVEFMADIPDTDPVLTTYKLGLLATTATGAAMSAGRDFAESVLHSADPNERHANRFARKNSDINPWH